MSDVLKAMTVDEIRAASAPVVELPAFENGVPLRARLRRASLISLLIANKIPNDLLAIAHEAMDKGIDPTGFDPGDLPKLGSLMKTMCSATLVEPTWEEVGELLTDEQINAIMLYATGGAKALDSFRERPTKPTQDGSDSESLGSEAE